MEHHANLVPWQQLCERTGATLRWLDVTARGPARPDRPGQHDHRADQDRRGDPPVERHRARSPPVAEIARVAHEVGALVLVDGAQSVPHQPVDVTALGADFLVFSGHKMLGPYGHRRAVRAGPSYWRPCRRSWPAGR